ncbi:tetratricopeptide repeat-containing sulfotransferase family protein [Pseudokordiimonas caeni]|uniref:tetratricopeptide repeat-containing sulfotransferase family protein n=1 Tax=Pseudokordiimonas caeni TaxID=2997908 RepID=UPI002811E6F4|nr:sulfotransferase [Pseudokordiimonas caeni]
MHPALKPIDDMLRRRDIAGAAAGLEAFMARSPDVAEAHLMAGRLAQMQADFAGMREAAGQAERLAPGHPVASLMGIEARIHLGEIAEASERLGKLEPLAAGNPVMLQHIAEFYTQAGRHADADSVYKAALAITPDDPRLLFNAATAALSLGRIDAAEALLDRAIEINPSDGDAWYNRATLRTWTSDNNHIAALEGWLKTGPAQSPRAVPVHYALAKEYEDTGDHAAAFRHLQAGGDLRAAHMRYNLLADTDAMALIASTFDADFAAGVPAMSDEPGPVFILGLPRTGTTLMERMLAAHDKVESLGEINDFAFALIAEAGPAQGKSDLIARTRDMDHAALGARYLRTSAGRGSGKAYRIDKTPSNFLYLGLIAKALPSARIIHLRRHPMDTCFAIYKTLFRMGYPWSYRLADIADYYVAYSRLMDHWRTVMPGRFLDMDYEALVADPEGESRRLSAHLGLDWSSAILDFHRSDAPSTTASAVQVRRPVYKSSVGKWQHYARELAPLAERLQAAGIDIGEGAVA